MDKIIKELNELKDKCDALTARRERLEREQLELKALLNQYKEFLGTVSHKKFSASSKKSKQEVNQTLLFDEADITAVHEEP
ncbi:MAG: hypothetical protein HUJ86_07455 [Synergistes sp.]|nr:hypothetical protein [Synergistes sp.]